MKFAQVYAIARIYAAWFVRSKLWLLNQLIIPASMYVVFALTVGRGYEVNALIGGSIAMFWNAGLNALSQQVFYYRVLDMFIASPVTPAIFAAGVSLGALLNTLLPSIPVLAAIAFHLGVRTASIVPVLLTALLLGSLVGVFMANTMRDLVRFGALANVAYYLLVLLPPVYYPLALVPGNVRGLVLLVPTTALADVTRALGESSHLQSFYYCELFAPHRVAHHYELCFQSL